MSDGTDPQHGPARPGAVSGDAHEAPVPSGAPAAGGRRPTGLEFSSEFRERLRGRDPEALTEFYESFFDRVYAYVRRMLGEEHLAEDVTQDIFMHIHRSLDTYDAARDLRPWVFTIATNKVRDYWRSRRFRDTQREASIADEDGGLQVESNERGPDDLLANAELGATLEEAVESLPEGMRTTLVLRYFEGLSFEAIGELIDRNEAAVRKRYSRALEELRKRLARHAGLSGTGLPESGSPEPGFGSPEEEGA